MNPVEARHPHIQHQHIGPQIFDELDGGLAVLGFADNLNVVDRFEQRTQTVAYDVVIFS